MERPLLKDFLVSPELQAFCGQISKSELMAYAEELEKYVNYLETLLKHENRSIQTQ